MARVSVKRLVEILRLLRIGDARTKVEIIGGGAVVRPAATPTNEGLR
jgi:hypothetical protein